MNYYRVSLYQRQDTYLGKEELETHLRSAGLDELLPQKDRTQTSFLRTMQQIENKTGLKFTVLKESHADTLWSVFLGRRNLGNYMVIRGNRATKNADPSWKGSKSRSYPKAKSKEDKVLFEEAVAKLDSALENPESNSYMIHLKTVEYLKQRAYFIETHNVGYSGQKTTDFIMEESYLQVLEDLQSLYSKFGMKFTIEPVEGDYND